MNENLNFFSASQESIENSSSGIESESMDLENKEIASLSSSFEDLFDLEDYNLLNEKNNKNQNKKKNKNKNSQITSLWDREIGSGSGDEDEDEEEEDENSIVLINCGEDRQLTEVPPPTRVVLTNKELFIDFTNCPDSFLLREHLRQEGKIEKKALLELCYKTQTVLRKEENLLHVQSPIIIVGDLHGQFYDLLNILAACGECEEGVKNYLFLGDYVDRGNFGIEIILYLFTLKVCQPKGCFLLRDHECRQLTSFFNFKSEVIEKYDEEIYDVIMETFDCLPIAAIVDDQFFCVHGGLSPKLRTLESINQIDRFCEPPSNGLFSELLWSDPNPEYDDPKNTQYAFTPNNLRGCGYHYSYQAVSRFLSSTNLTCLIRAHEAQQDGYMMYRKLLETNFPSLITIFSSPNYAGLDQNKGAVIQYQNRSVTIKEFKGVSHPYWLPKYYDVFTWSIPFIETKIGSFWDIFLNLKPSSNLSFLDNKIEFNKNIQIETDELIFNPNTKIKKNPRNKKRFLNKQHSTILMSKVRLIVLILNDFAKIRKKIFFENYKKKNHLSNIRRTQSIQPSLFFNTNPMNQNIITTTNYQPQLQKLGLFRATSLEGHLLKLKLEMGFKKMWLAAEKENRELQIKASKLLMGEKNFIFEKIENVEYDQEQNIKSQKKPKLCRSESVKEIIEIENIDELIQQDEFKRSQKKKRKLFNQRSQKKINNKIRRTNKNKKKKILMKKIQF
ncbi:serine/threonine-protein phosphatase 2b catalytic subunit alpha [Anaeramoeba flamelloides]|uniref:Serine/threonine-protein phosphatase 2b catalytic subunit alpha n=1 Tax=Anaeramoeba flamelloides TaxID=1746091 RepID=A0AAV7Z180_9EUKA|nr:serine/threonine-protein phosphatase 2b catalytic subunit alpha [Anaeramoeba flamelloides]